MAVIDLGFALGLRRVEAWCDVRNARSIRFAECLGMQRENVRRSTERDAQGQPCDQLVLSRVRLETARSAVLKGREKTQ